MADPEENLWCRWSRPGRNLPYVELMIQASGRQRLLLIELIQWTD